MTKELRKGKVLVDWSQNDWTKTTVAVYSLRAETSPRPRRRCTGRRSSGLADDGDPESVRFEAPEVLERVERARRPVRAGARAEAEAAEGGALAT